MGLLQLLPFPLPNIGFNRHFAAWAQKWLAACVISLNICDWTSCDVMAKSCWSLGIWQIIARMVWWGVSWIESRPFFYQSHLHVCAFFNSVFSGFCSLFIVECIFSSFGWQFFFFYFVLLIFCDIHGKALWSPITWEFWSQICSIAKNRRLMWTKISIPQSNHLLCAFNVFPSISAILLLPANSHQLILFNFPLKKLHLIITRLGVGSVRYCFKLVWL